MSRSPRSVRTRPLAAAAVALMAFSGLAACQPFGPPKPGGGTTPTAPDTYVALGDSFVAGPMIPAQSLSPLGCFRSTRNYPQLAAKKINVAKLVDVSCSGAVTSDLFRAQSVTPGPANAPQVDALNSRTKVVTLGIGGNDIGFSDIVSTCATQNPFGKGCAAGYTAGGVDQLSTKITETAPKVGKILAEITKRAPQATVYVVGYPTVVPATGNGCYPMVPVLAKDIPYLRAKVTELNAMLAQQAAKAGAHYIDLATPSIGHDFCSASKWVEGIVPTAPAAPVHPNAAGMAGMSVTVANTINATLPR